MFGLFSHLPPEGRALVARNIGAILGRIEEVGGSFTYLTEGEDPHILITCEGRSFRIDSSKVVDPEELNLARIDARHLGQNDQSEMEVRVKTLQLLAGRVQ